MANFDVILIGGGHNSLIVAAYLAKAGINVCILERNPHVGGGVITKEVTLPGFKHDLCSTQHWFISANPLIRNDELKLQSKYGLNYIPADPSTAIIFPDESSIVFHRDIDKTCESIAKISQRDAETYRKFYEWSIPCLNMLTMGMFSPPPLNSVLVSMLEKSEQGQEILISLQKSALDIVDDWFESDKVKIAMTRLSSEVLFAPYTRGCGALLFAVVASAQRDGFTVCEGGSGSLANSLERCLGNLGGTIKTSSSVKSIKVEGGEAKGVILESGEEIIANKAVISTINVKQLFLQMLGAEHLPPNFQTKVRRLKHSEYSAFVCSLALNEAPKYKAGSDVDRCHANEIASNDMETYLKEFDALRYGYPVTDFPLMVCNTLYDRTRAPAGKHTLFVYQYASYNLKGGGAARWDQIKEEVADNILNALRQYTTNMDDKNILGRYVESPLDFERYNPAFVNADECGIGHQSFQTLSNRPLMGWNYRTPVKKLYMAGACTHPGGGVTGGGRAAVQVVMEDLGIDFKKVIG